MVAALLLLVAFFRWFDIDRESFSIDGTQIIIKSIQVFRHGNFTFIGPPMSAGTSHSPFSVYLYGLPVLLTPDQRIAILFTGALNVIAAALLFKICARYFSFSAGVIALLLFSVHPEALYISRQILNISITPPFVLAFLFTGLLGYYEEKRYARWLHLPFMSLAAQGHPGGLFLTVITILLSLYALWQQPTQRKQILTDTIMSGALAGVLFIPWGIGIYQQIDLSQPQTSFTILKNQGLAFALDQTIGIIGSWENSFAKTVLPPLAFIGAAWLAIRSARRQDALPGLVVLLSIAIIPLTYFFLNIKYRGFYFWPVYSNVFIVLGAVLGGVRLRKPEGSHPRFDWRGLLSTPYIGWVAWIIVALIVYTHINFFSRSGAQPPTIGDYTNSVNTAHQLAQKTNRDLLMLIPYGAQAQYDYFPWEVLNEGRANSRVIWHGRALPLPANGAVLVGPADYNGRPSIFSNGSIINSKFRLTDLPPADQFKPDRPLPAPVMFNNGVTVVGFLQPSTQPEAGQTWTVFMLWRQDELKNQENGIFAHLLNDKGDKFAQADVSALPVGQQRAGEMALSQLEFKLPNTFPSNGELFLRFGFTNKGEVVGDSVLQIRGAGKAAVTWDNGLVLDRFQVSEKILQGPPIEIKATWFTTKALPDLKLRLVVKSSSGQVVSEKVEDLKILPNVFLSGNYQLRIPTDAAAGIYTIEVSLADSRGEKVGESYKVSAEVTARPRKFQVPQMQKTINASFADQIRLLGYDLKLEGKKLNLTLHWQAVGQIEKSYKFFVHVLRDGEVKAQLDALPDQGRYLTLWWARDEVYSETISLDLASLDAGTYTLNSGWYDAFSQQRLGDVVTLQEIALK